MVETQESCESRRNEILQAELRQAADSRDVAGICTAYVKTAIQILSEFPNMNVAEKQTHYARLREDIERLKMQAGQDCSKVLGELQKILAD